jgi:hypothetical protein
MNNNEFMSSEYYSAMQTGEPRKVFKKVILAKVFVQVLNPFDGKPEGKILQGIPSSNDEGCFVPIWSEKEEAFFVRMNKSHILDGRLINVPIDNYMNVISIDGEEKINYGAFTEEQIKEIATSKFMALKATLNKTDSEEFVYRILEKANELERPEGTVTAIKVRLSEIQSLDVVEE